ncbi:MAG: hypothetical protein QXU09_03500 [Thermoproteota archaeon]
MSSINEVCPLMSKDNGKTVCVKKYCALYDSEMRMCAIRQIALSLYTIAIYGVKTYAPLK